MGITWGPTTVGSSSLGTPPSVTPPLPLLGISAIKAVGVASSPALDPPVPHSPRGGHCPAWTGGRAEGAPSLASKEQQAGPGDKPGGACCRQRAWKCPRLPRPGLGAPLTRIQAPKPPCRWFVMESPRSYSTPTSAPGDRASPPCVGPLPLPTPHMTIVRFVSGVGNLLGFFPTIMALSVPVFSVFSTCEMFMAKS